MRFVAAAVLCASVLFASASPAQEHSHEPFNLAVPVTELSQIFTSLYGPDGLVVDSIASLAGGVSHSGHFNSGFETEFGQFGTALTLQLVSLPLPPPSAGFTYQFDPALGVFTRSTTSFGPIFSERADTIGAGRVAIGFAYQRLKFDSIEGMDLGRVPAIFTHDGAELLGGREDVVATVNSIESSVTRSSAFLTFGVSNSLDISVAIPFITADVVVRSEATIHRIGTETPEIHFFRGADDEIGDSRIFTAFGHASGPGDVTVRLKQTVARDAVHGVAVGVDMRLPTGDERNLLGTGGPGVQPFVAWSATFGALSPHANAGYQWNGTSQLGGSPGSGLSGDLPDVGVYSVGTVVAVHPRVTAAVDILGRYIVESPRVRPTTFHALDGTSTFDSVTFTTSSFNELSGAAGVKVNVAGQLLLNANLLFQLNSSGLRDRVSPLIGVEYAF
jgi:hypothetical protein